MNLELIREWVEALRSGKYEQGRLALRSIDNKYCPLGVLCDIAKDRLSLEWMLLNGKFRYDIGKNEMTSSSIILPLNVRDLLLGTNMGGHCGLPIDVTKLSSELGIPSDIKTLTVMDLNDEYKLSHTQIADILEQQYLM